ncbi:hypothetical protein RFI_11871 [Reticulomyxa filosa]|uniref:Uncharacterized protein n=1 Tax=Reticulomyxa filosa TaxID=46433 RepID=X6NG07_RETFI|nr:hypothetical protein RFI_11871 [Reticulomyxa filosa]|eukprot:ETO25265.1 hypothetical protein RFI_11871 [Reticulomyxa filosa]
MTMANRPPLVFSNDDNICSRIAKEGLQMFNSNQLLCNIAQKESGRTPSYRISVFAKLDVQKIAKIKYAPVLGSPKKGGGKHAQKVDEEKQQAIPNMASQYLLAVFNLPNPKKSLPASVTIYEFNTISKFKKKGFFFFFWEEELNNNNNNNNNNNSNDNNNNNNNNNNNK